MANRAGSLEAVTQTGPAPEANISLVRGTTIAALIYHGVLLLGAVGIALFMFLVALPFEASNAGSGVGFQGVAGTMLLLIIGLVALTIPVVLAVWMLRAVRRNDSGQVLSALAVYSVFTGIALAGMYIVSGIRNQVTGLYLFIPTTIIITVGWVGWVRMRRTSAAVRFPDQMHQLSPHSTAPVQQHAPTPYHLPPAPQPGSSPWYGQGSPWKGQNPPWPGGPPVR